MSKKDKWLYFNIHDVVGLRLEVGHCGEHSCRLVFDSFQVESLDHIDLTLQNSIEKIDQYSLASDVYDFTQNYVNIKKYKLRLLRQDNHIIMASERDLLPFVMPVIQWLLLEKQHCFVHGAAIAVNGQGILLPGWGGTGKTSAIICLLKETPNSSFLGDDYAILGADGELLSFPKSFFIFPYHRDLFPHLFKGKGKRKRLIPSSLLGFFSHIRGAIRPAVMAWPKLEAFMRRITPMHMQVPARVALPDVEFSAKVPLGKVLFVERYTGQETVMEKVSLPEAKRRLIGNWNFEQGQCAIDMIIGAGGTAVMDLEAYYSQMSAVLDKALSGRDIYVMRMGPMGPKETGRAIVDAVREITSS